VAQGEGPEFKTQYRKKKMEGYWFDILVLPLYDFHLPVSS
jgi:hypothetical protein